jgi:hypothetical protein
VAEEEYDVARAALRDIKHIARDLDERVRDILQKPVRDGGPAGEARNRLNQLSERLAHAASESLDAAEQSLVRKRKRLRKFTVTLFGRTLAGKSTIREAITGGDGSTIGRGAQRTTKDIREYEWNHLRIVDTPGIGAYQGEEDRRLALSVIDESDLILFLVSSDGIQEESFRGMQALRSLNKPMVFVLNVKCDLTKPVLLKRFLRDPSVVLGEAQVRGHWARIGRLAGDHLGMPRIQMVVIHAQAAFLARQPEHRRYAAQLHEASRIKDLLRLLEEDVNQQGPVRRLQTILDGTINVLADVQEMLREQAKVIRAEAIYLKRKYAELDAWLDAYTRGVNERIEGEVSVFVKPLKDSVSRFVDENIERRDVAERWKHKVELLRVDDWIYGIEEDIHNEVNARLKEFGREIQVERELSSTLQVQGPETYDPWDVRRTLRWTSAGSAALAGVAAVAACVGGANFWNPLGWALGAVSLGALALSWFFRGRESKVQQQKAKAAAHLRGQVDEMAQRIAANLKKWFNSDITSILVRRIRKETKSIYNGMFDLARALDDASRDCGKTIETLNRRLLRRAGEFSGSTISPRSIGKVARDSGLRAKFIWTDGAERRGFCVLVSRALDEWVDGIVSGPMDVMIASALAPAKVVAEDVHIADGVAIVEVPSDEAGKAIGKQGGNVLLASRLLEMGIRIQPRR